MTGALRRIADWFMGHGADDEYVDDFEFETRTYDSRGVPTYDEPEPLPDDAPQPRSGGLFGRGRASREGEVVEMRPTQPMTSILYPRSWKDAQNLADQFKSGTFLILDLSRVEDKDRARLVNFLCGVAYGCDGKSQRINDLTFAFAPRSHALHAGQNNDYSTSDDTGSGVDVPRFSAPA
ncbi:MAG TPA: hypothetical protein DCZ72_02490 [Armatimonadetes bacterium]|nr:hypothetical protein [Armatimonadota bacterium]